MTHDDIDALVQLILQLPEGSLERKKAETELLILAEKRKLLPPVDKRSIDSDDAAQEAFRNFYGLFD